MAEEKVEEKNNKGDILKEERKMNVDGIVLMARKWKVEGEEDEREEKVAVAKDEIKKRKKVLDIVRFHNDWGFVTTQTRDTNLNIAFDKTEKIRWRPNRNSQRMP